MSQNKKGKNAAKNGNSIEGMLIPLFQNHQFPVFSETETKKNPQLIDNADHYILKNVPFTNIYEQPGRTEYVLVNKDRRVRLEIKSQMARGSVDEKLAYAYHNAAEAYPENESIILLVGNGFRKGAKNWLRKAVDSTPKELGRTIHLFSLDEFIPWFIHFAAE